MSESAAGSLWPLFDPAVLGQVDWSAVVTQVPSLLALVLLTFLCLVIYLGAFELAGNLELDWNREFKVVGLASMADLGGRSARFEVRATEPCKASMLTPEAARWLEKNEPTLMLKLYRYLIGQAPTATRERTA